MLIVNCELLLLAGAIIWLYKGRPVSTTRGSKNGLPSSAVFGGSVELAVSKEKSKDSNLLNIAQYRSDAKGGVLLRQ